MPTAPKRHQPRKAPAKKKKPPLKCFTRTTNAGARYVACAGGRAKPKPKAKAPKARRAGPLEERLVPGISRPLYPDARSMREGARRQFIRHYSPGAWSRIAALATKEQSANLGRGKRVKKKNPRYA